jgi:HSP20 family molecular chaperone IbpA
MNLPIKRKSGLLDRFFNNESLFDFDPFENLTEQFGRFFGPCCYTNEGGDVIYQIEVPGFNKDNLKVEISDGILTIRGEREVKDKYYAGQSKFFKQLTVGDISEADAEVVDGILTLTVKRPQKEPGKQIEVK